MCSAPKLKRRLNMVIYSTNQGKALLRPQGSKGFQFLLTRNSAFSRFSSLQVSQGWGDPGSVVSGPISPRNGRCVRGDFSSQSPRRNGSVRHFDLLRFPAEKAADTPAAPLGGEMGNEASRHASPDASSRHEESLVAVVAQIELFLRAQVAEREEYVRRVGDGEF